MLIYLYLSVYLSIYLSIYLTLMGEGIAGHEMSLHHYSISCRAKKGFYIISTDALRVCVSVYVQAQHVWQVMCFLIEGAICSLWHRNYFVPFPSCARKFLQAPVHLLVTFPFTQPAESNQAEISLSHIISSSALRHSHCPRQAEKKLRQNE